MACCTAHNAERRASGQARAGCRVRRAPDSRATGGRGNLVRRAWAWQAAAPPRVRLVGWLAAATSCGWAPQAAPRACPWELARVRHA